MESSNYELALIITDERDPKSPPRQETVKLLPGISTFSMGDLCNLVLTTMNISKREQDSFAVVFKADDSNAIIKEPAEILALKRVYATIIEKEQTWSDVAEQDKSHVAEEHINPMPFFLMHRSVTHTIVDPRLIRREGEGGTVSDKDSAEGSIIDIPMEKHMLLLPPKIMKLNHKPSTPMQRSKSVRNKYQEAINEWEGGERQDVKISKYTKCDIKQHTLANGGRREDFFIEGLKRRMLEQGRNIAKMKEEFKELEELLISQTETINYCKKGVESEWDKRKDKLKIELTEKFTKNFENLLRERLDVAIKERKGEFNQILLDLIKDQLNSL